ncbi:hypothetical protein GCM10007388_36090 [Pseudoduganella plicata]|uniref:Uncharacterized protein n=1 Tax=Pseudoduganella plicata TaxID=321984 RepID=A0AA87YAG6_9BURK|nr:hypothetical protein GCM10007388_36090 [Pseudoduganella plicata]
MDLQRAKQPGKIHLLSRGDALVAENQHMVLQVRGVDALQGRAVQRLVEIEAYDFGANRAIERTYFERIATDDCT